MCVGVGVLVATPRVIAYPLSYHTHLDSLTRAVSCRMDCRPRYRVSSPTHTHTQPI